MKGIVFTEFLEMVEQRFGLDMVDQLVCDVALPHGGAYTAVDTYPHEELLRLVGALSCATGTPVNDLVRAFGEYLFQRFTLLYGRFFDGVTSAFDFLGSVQDYVHVEVFKLYPEAELPTFRSERQSPARMVMLYESKRPFADLAEGLLQGCIRHFGETMLVTREDLPSEEMTRVRFTLTRER